MKTSWWILLFCLLGSVKSLTAQSLSSLFQPLSWEEASMRAARENKLVLVVMGPVDEKTDKAFPEALAQITDPGRYFVAIRMNANTPAGQAFLPRLLMYEPPYYAFFMPYGDLVGGIAAGEVVSRPQALREALETARGQAEVKRTNSRSIRFADLPLEEALRQAGEQEKPVFIALHQQHNQPGLLMEKNIYRLDRTADFYNRHFLCLRMEEAYAGELVRHYGIKEFPAFLYLNADGKLLKQAWGYQTAEELIRQGEESLKKAAGIAFDTISPQEAGVKAGREGKLVFTDYYIPDTKHTELVKKVYADPEVSDFFTEHFVNTSREADEHVMVFTDAGGKELHRVTGVATAADLLQEAARVVDGKGIAGLETRYRSGDRTAAFMEDYTRMLYRAGWKEQASAIAREYLSTLSPGCLRTARYWEFFDRYVLEAEPAFFDELLAHRQEYYSLYGEKEVNRKISALWIAGAEGFVKDGVFDETGFKEYTRRLKKEKVEGWRSIVRNARMHAAEKTGDWKTYVNLAEEKWNEEEVPEAELYSWGVKINEACRDEGIRYKAARWFAEEALKMEQKERLTGKVKLSSYKGFFEKLADDLVGRE